MASGKSNDINTGVQNSSIAAIEFIYETFPECTLKFAINSVNKWPNLLRTSESPSKTLVLFLLNKVKVLAGINSVLENHDDKLNELLKENFVIIALDISGKTAYLESVIQAFQLNNLIQCHTLAKNNESALVFLDWKDMSWLHRHTFVSAVDIDKFKTAIVNSLNKDSLNMSPQIFHQSIYDRFRNRYYVIYEPDQHEWLKFKIGFALYGLPQITNQNDVPSRAYILADQIKVIEKIYTAIRKSYNESAEYPDYVCVATLFTFVEFLSKGKKIESLTEPIHTVVPVFVVRRCVPVSSKQQDVRKMSQFDGCFCRTFVDHEGRVYTTWIDYLKNNKLLDCRLTTPLDGAPYTFEENTKGEKKLRLQQQDKLRSIALNIVDITAGVISTVSTSTALMSPMTGPAAFPLLVTSLAIGRVADTYLLSRSAYNMHDLVSHKDFELKESRSRRALVSVIGSSAGLVVGASSGVVRTLLARGVNIGRMGIICNDVFIGSHMAFQIFSASETTVTTIIDILNEGELDSEKILKCVAQLICLALAVGNVILTHQFTSAMIAAHEADAMSPFKWQKLLMTSIGVVEQVHSNLGERPVSSISCIKYFSSPDEFAELLMSLQSIDMAVDLHASEVNINGVCVDIITLHQYYCDALVESESAFKESGCINVQFMVDDTFNDLIASTNIVHTLTDSISCWHIDHVNKYISSVCNQHEGSCNFIKNIFALAIKGAEIIAPLDVILRRTFPSTHKYCFIVSRVIRWLNNYVATILDCYTWWQQNKSNAGARDYLKRIDMCVDTFLSLSADETKRKNQIFHYLYVGLNRNSKEFDLLYNLISDYIKYMSTAWCIVKNKSECQIQKMVASADTPRARQVCSKCHGYTFSAAC